MSIRAENPYHKPRREDLPYVRQARTARLQNSLRSKAQSSREDFPCSIAPGTCSEVTNFLTCLCA